MSRFKMQRCDHVEAGFAFQAAKRPDDALRAFEAATIHEVCGYGRDYYYHREGFRIMRTTHGLYHELQHVHL